MLKWMCVAAGGVLLATAAPAWSQEPGEEDFVPAKQITGPSIDVIREAVETIRQAAECTVTFTIGVDGKPKDMEPDCTLEAYTPYALRAMETVEYRPESFGDEVFETEGVKQPFVFGTVAAESNAPGDTPPEVIRDVAPADISRAITRVDEPGTCDITMTIGVNGEPKNIVPNCTPSSFDSHIRDAFAKMRFKPGEKDGKPIEWPGFKQPINLTKGE